MEKRVVGHRRWLPVVLNEAANMQATTNTQNSDKEWKQGGWVGAKIETIFTKEAPQKGLCQRSMPEYHVYRARMQLLSTDQLLYTLRWPMTASVMGASKPKVMRPELTWFTRCGLSALSLFNIGEEMAARADVA
jgi:hypothetical protein